MSDDDDETVPIPVLKVDNLLPQLEPHLSNRALSIFANQRPSTDRDIKFFGRVVVDETPEAIVDFAERLNKLFETFNGFKFYLYQGNHVAPRIEACLSVPMRIPIVSSTGERLEAAVSGKSAQRYIYVAYVFVEGLDGYESDRLWINSVVGDFILASAEGELPMNSEK